LRIYNVKLIIIVVKFKIYLSSADLAYYLDVTNRVNKKLLEVE
jgi:hypothetical protein